jgi:hypothetical protein
MAKIATTSQKKNTMTPGMAYPDTVLAFATDTSYPTTAGLMRRRQPATTTPCPIEVGVRTT